MCPAWARRAGFVLAVLLLVAMPKAAEPQAPRMAALSETDRADIARIEDHLNRMTTLKAHFLQHASDGGFSEGDIYISRPGKLRIEYDPPVPILMVSGGSWLIYYDKKLEQVSYFGLDSTPASYFLKDHVALSGDVTVTGIERGPGVIRVSLIKSEDPLAGKITLVFGDRPLALKKWTVVDAQGTETTVSLLEVRTGLDLDPDLFRFADPREMPESDR